MWKLEFGVIEDRGEGDCMLLTVFVQNNLLYSTNGHSVLFSAQRKMS